MLVPGPVRHDEKISFLPIEPLFLDHAVPAPADDEIDDARSMPVRASVHSGLQELNAAGNRCHHRPARERIAVFERHVVERACLCIGELPQRIECRLPPVDEQRRAFPRRRFLPAWTQQAAAVHLERIFGRLLGLLFPPFELLEKGNVQEIDERDVQSIHPDHRLVRFIAVVVSQPTRRQNEISRLDVELFPFDGRVRAVSFDDEAKRVGRVAMGIGDFSRQYHLHPGDKRVRRAVTAAESGVEQARMLSSPLFLRRYPLARPPAGGDRSGFPTSIHMA